MVGFSRIYPDLVGFSPIRRGLGSSDDLSVAAKPNSSVSLFISLHPSFADVFYNMGVKVDGDQRQGWCCLFRGIPRAKFSSIQLSCSAGGE